VGFGNKVYSSNSSHKPQTDRRCLFVDVGSFYKVMNMHSSVIQFPSENFHWPRVWLERVHLLGNPVPLVEVEVAKGGEGRAFIE
jgi:hypothetical protein